jgi:CBS domain-containing protein
MTQAEVAVSAEDLPVVVAAPAATVAMVVESSASLAMRAEIVTVETDTGVSVAKVILDDVKLLRGEVEEDLGGPKQAAHKLWKALGAVYNKHSEPLNEIEKKVKQKIAFFVDDQERKRRVEEAKAEAARVKAEDDLRQSEAIALEDAGLHEEANEVLEEELPLPPPPVVPPKTKGISGTKRYAAEITDPLKLVIAAANGDGLAIAIITDKAVVKAMTASASGKARALKEQLKVPGVRVTSTTSISHRGA